MKLLLFISSFFNFFHFLHYYFFLQKILSFRYFRDFKKFINSFFLKAIHRISRRSYLKYLMKIRSTMKLFITCRSRNYLLQCIYIYIFNKWNKILKNLSHKNSIILTYAIDGKILIDKKIKSMNVEGNSDFIRFNKRLFCFLFRIFNYTFINLENL